MKTISNDADYRFVINRISSLTKNHFLTSEEQAEIRQLTQLAIQYEMHKYDYSSYAEMHYPNFQANNISANSIGF